MGVRLTNLVSTASVARQTAMLYRIVERVNVGDFDSDERECGKVVVMLWPRAYKDIFLSFFVGNKCLKQSYGEWSAWKA